MDFFDVVRTRRSVRSYRADPVDDELIRQVLQAGMAAPSAGNRQPWEFIVIREDRALKEAIANVTYRGNSFITGEHQTWLTQAPVLIVICANVQRSAARYGWEHAYKIVLQDIAAAVENMLLAATALGLASCWVAGFDQVALAALLNVPELVPPIAILPLGYATAMPTPPPKLDPKELVRAWL